MRAYHGTASEQPALEIPVPKSVDDEFAAGDRHRELVTLLLLARFSLQISHAQTPATTLALTGARLIDSTGRPVLEQATLVISNSNGRVEAVGALVAVKVPAGAVRIDMFGKTIMPGLINPLGHVSATLDKGSKMSVRDHMMEQLRVYAAYGVTTVLSFGMAQDDESENLKLRDELAHQTFDVARIKANRNSAEPEMKTV